MALTCFVGLMSNFFKCSEETFQMMCFNPKIQSPNLSFFGLGPWYGQIGNNFIAKKIFFMIP